MAFLSQFQARIAVSAIEIVARLALRAGWCNLARDSDSTLLNLATFFAVVRVACLCTIAHNSIRYLLNFATKPTKTVLLVIADIIQESENIFPAKNGYTRNIQILDMNRGAR